MAKFIDASGQLQSDVDLNGVALYKEAITKKISVRQLINQKYPTAQDQPETFKQMCYHAGIRLATDPETGQPASTLAEIFEGPEAASGFTNQPATPDSRILFPATIMAIMEDKMKGKHDTVTSIMDSIVGYSQTISTAKFETPVLSYGGAQGPENSQFQAISQNTAPPLMLSLTAADVTRKVPTTSIGMEISQEALQATPFDLVALTLNRFYSIAAYNKWMDDITYLLNGDPDAVVTSFSAGTSALSSVTAQSFDSSITTAGTLTHTAYIKWLLNNPLYSVPSHIICDVNAALAIENRTGRPTNVQENSTDRLDSPMSLVWPNLGSNVQVIALPVGSFPANTLMGLDVSAPAIGKVTSLFADYSGVEDVILKRSRVMRFDTGSLLYRFFDSAFSVMTLTV